jgi:dsRNA-specific ribonuclease
MAFNTKNPISVVQEYCARFRFTPNYEEDVDPETNQFRNTLTVRSIDGHVFTTRGLGPNKKTAKTNAAQLMLQQLQQPILGVPAPAPEVAAVAMAPMAAAAPVMQNPIAAELAGYFKAVPPTPLPVVDLGSQAPLSPPRQEANAPSLSMSSPMPAALFLSKAQVAMINLESNLKALAAKEFAPGTNYTGHLNEYCQKNGQIQPNYQEVQRMGPSNTPKFKMSCSVVIPNKGSYEAEGIYDGTKKAAQQMLAFEIIKKLAVGLSAQAPAQVQEIPAAASCQIAAPVQETANVAIQQLVKSEISSMEMDSSAPTQDQLVQKIVAEVISRMETLGKLNGANGQPSGNNISDAVASSGNAVTGSFDEGFCSSGPGTSGNASPDESGTKSVEIAGAAAAVPAANGNVSGSVLPNLGNEIDTQAIISKVKSFIRTNSTTFQVAGSANFLTDLCKKINQHGVPAECTFTVIPQGGEYHCSLKLDIEQWVGFHFNRMEKTEQEAKDSVAHLAISRLQD